MAAPPTFANAALLTLVTAHANHSLGLIALSARSRDWRVGNFIRRAGLVPGMAVQTLKLRHLVF